MVTQSSLPYIVIWSKEKAKCGREEQFPTIQSRNEQNSLGHNGRGLIHRGGAVTLVAMLYHRRESSRVRDQGGLSPASVGSL